MWNEAPVEIYQSQKFAELALSRWPGKVSDNFNLAVKWANSLRSYPVAKEIQLRSTKLALRGIYNNAISIKTLKELAEVVLVLFFVGASDQQIVQISKTEWETAQGFIHKSLEGLRRVPQTERHPQILEQPKRGRNGRLGDV